MASGYLKVAGLVGGPDRDRRTLPVVLPAADSGVGLHHRCGRRASRPGRPLIRAWVAGALCIRIARNARNADPVKRSRDQILPAVTPTQHAAAEGDQAMKRAGKHHRPEQPGGDQGGHHQRHVRVRRGPPATNCGSAVRRPARRIRRSAVDHVAGVATRLTAANTQTPGAALALPVLPGHGRPDRSAALIARPRSGRRRGRNDNPDLWGTAPGRHPTLCRLDTDERRGRNSDAGENPMSPRGAGYRRIQEHFQNLEAFQVIRAPT